MDNDQKMQIKNIVLYYYTEFLNETRDKEVALKLTEEAMTTYRTLMISESKTVDKITPNQLRFLKEQMSDFEHSKTIILELQRLNKESLDELTKHEASELISKILGR